jgi:hypothetical protein
MRAHGVNFGRRNTSDLLVDYWLRVSELAGLREQERAGDDLGLPLRRDDFVVRPFGNGNSIIPK